MRISQDFTQSSGVNNGKGTKDLVQLQRVFDEYFTQPLTMKMVSVKCDIDRGNVCWFNRDLRHLGRIRAVRKGICPITKHHAIYWTTNPVFFPQPTQLNLFEQ